MMSFDKSATQAQAAIAAGIEFQLALDRRAVGQEDRCGDDGNLIMESDGDRLARARIVKRVRRVEPDNFRRRIDLDDEPAEESGIQNSVATPSSLAFRR